MSLETVEIITEYPFNDTGFTLEEAVKFSCEMRHEDGAYSLKKIDDYDDYLHIISVVEYDEFISPVFIFRYNNDTKLYDFRGVSVAEYRKNLYERI